MHLTDYDQKMILAGTVAALVLYKVLKPRDRNLPPGPPAWPIVGNLLGKAPLPPLSPPPPYQHVIMVAASARQLCWQ